MEYKSYPAHIMRAKWYGMIKRCYDETEPGYHRYGGRGIYVSPEWHDYSTFKNDMMPSWKPGLTLERVDNDGPYSLENVRWVTRKEQASNRRSNIKIEHNGEVKTLSQWAEQNGIKAKTAWQRFRTYGWSAKRSVGLED